MGDLPGLKPRLRIGSGTGTEGASSSPGVFWQNLPKCESGLVGSVFFEVGSVGSLWVAASLESAGIPRVLLDFLAAG